MLHRQLATLQNSQLIHPSSIRMLPTRLSYISTELDIMPSSILHLPQDKKSHICTRKRWKLLATLALEIAQPPDAILKDISLSSSADLSIRSSLSRKRSLC